MHSPFHAAQRSRRLSSRTFLSLHSGSSPLLSPDSLFSPSLSDFRLFPFHRVTFSSSLQPHHQPKVMQSSFLSSMFNASTNNNNLTDPKSRRRSSINQLFQAVTTADISRLPVDRRLPDFVVYRSLSRFVMSKERMITYGYPVPDDKSREPGKVLIPTGIYPTTANYFNSNQRTCSRCKEIFQVKDDGTPVIWKQCFYHRGMLKHQHRSGIMSYSCCYKPYSSEGCKVSDSHVVDGSGHPDYDRHFRQTVKKNGNQRTRDNCPGVYALDCEMVSIMLLFVL